ncbi:diguanylate cyclase (GGDEF) domain-containing protein [Marinospirillum celere]|uniref:Diguanylate cyclase (GGDEF) domain-containing protein n=1 Tax=Marinospirillum celere TaxID=1122252 RepID=A0A1I1HTI4_9GAMM|nr:EAL domain-containing protein [Marinospirillum celere]SFC27224.1 diguanylate cyclase (GGDEF) domain-containing protein [Marinospirillum celere]
MTDKLLILDDDELTGKTLKSLAEFAGYEVEFTSSSDMFFRLLTSWQPQIVILDLVMSPMDGVEVLTEMTRLETSSSIIITSGVGSRVLDAAARSAAARQLKLLGTLPKPFTSKELFELLNRTPAPVPSVDQIDTAKYLPSRQDLLQLIDQQQLSLAFQPKISCSSGQLIGFEALARWRHPTEGSVPPENFIAQAEAEDLIDPLTEQIMQQALSWFGSFKNQHTKFIDQELSPNDLHLSINLSAKSLSNEQLFITLEALCQEHQVAPHEIVLELTETAAMEDPTYSMETLTRLRIKGFQVSIDDFGIGFSSIQQLVRLPFSELKIDKTFVLSALASLESRLVVKAIIDLAHSLNIRVTAEGIEDQETLQLLKDQGCDAAQGFYLGRPQPPTAIPNWLEEHGRYLEEQRLRNLQQLKILDTPPEERFDRVTLLARKFFDVPISLVSLVDRDRQWFKSKVGTELLQTPRSQALCNLAIQQDQTFIADESFISSWAANKKNLPYDPEIKFYAGHPIRSAEGYKLGTLCILDHKPRYFSDKQIQLLEDLARLVEYELAAYDSLYQDKITELVSRPAFEQRAPQLLALAREHQLPVTLIAIHLDNLRLVNKAEGLPAGDQLLENFSQLLQASFRDTDLLARLGGAEFVVLLLDESPEAITTRLELLYMLTQQINGQGEPPQVFTYEYGLASVQKDDDYQWEKLYLLADQQLYASQPPLKKS